KDRKSVPELARSSFGVEEAAARPEQKQLSSSRIGLHVVLPCELDDQLAGAERRSRIVSKAFEKDLVHRDIRDRRDVTRLPSFADCLINEASGVFTVAQR